MSNRSGYWLLVGLGTILVIVLMLDDPAARLEQMQAFRATQRSEQPQRLFTQMTSPEAIDGIEVLDVTTGRGILLVRGPDSLWYAPDIRDIQPYIAAEVINQQRVENAAAAIVLLAADQWFEATDDNFERFGLRPEPAYRIRFQTHDESGKTYEGLVDIGDANPDNVAYYGHISTQAGAEQIFLVRKQIVDIILTMLFEPIELQSTSYASPTDYAATPPSKP